MKDMPLNLVYFPTFNLEIWSVSEETSVSPFFLPLIHFGLQIQCICMYVRRHSAPSHTPHMYFQGSHPEVFDSISKQVIKLREDGNSLL